jgi:hypothetical protein
MDNKDKFLEELASLTSKYGIVVSGEANHEFEIESLEDAGITSPVKYDFGNKQYVNPYVSARWCVMK